MNYTSESPVQGLTVFQPEDGFRYGAEAFWVVGLVLERGRPQSVLDLGTGSGIMAGLFAAQGARVTGIDVRAEWLPYWSRTLAESSVSGTLELRLGDVRKGWSEPVDVVVANPPFFRADEGPSSPNPWKRAARTGEDGVLEAFVTTGAQAIGATGRMYMVLPKLRVTEAQTAAHLLGLHLNNRINVGRKRALLAWSRVAAPSEPVSVLESDERIRQWYRLATAPS